MKAPEHINSFSEYRQSAIRQQQQQQQPKDLWTISQYYLTTVAYVRYADSGVDTFIRHKGRTVQEKKRDRHYRDRKSTIYTLYVLSVEHKSYAGRRDQVCSMYVSFTSTRERTFTRA